MENRGRLLQNIILAGGTCMVPGFKKRLVQEIKFQIMDRFEQLQVHFDKVCIPECIYPPNVINWVGASLLMSVGKESDLFLLTLEQYNEDE